MHADSEFKQIFCENGKRNNLTGPCQFHCINIRINVERAYLQAILLYDISVHYKAIPAAEYRCPERIRLIKRAEFVFMKNVKERVPNVDHTKPNSNRTFCGSTKAY